MENEDIPIVRRFNRVVSQRIGALDTSYLSRGRPLGEARLLFEIGEEGADIADLRSRLGLDSGYLSRLLRSLETQGLARVGNEEGHDGRRRRAVLTEAGRIERAAYDELSDVLARSMLPPPGSSQRTRMLAAMAEVERLMQADAVELAVEPPESRDARWCLMEYCAELAERFEEGFDPARGNAVDEAEMRPPAGAFLLARLHGRPVGCGVLKRLDDRTGEIKRMWVSSQARGIGLATRLLARLEEMARDRGFRTVRLDTNRALTEAQAMYRKAGYREIARYNANSYADFWYEKYL